jgi:hypothetical protein
MALTITTANAEGLRRWIVEKLGQRAIEGWENDGDSFTLTDPEWGGKAWVRAFLESGQLVLGLVPSQGGVMTDGLYTAYHSRLVEMLLRHFRDLVSAMQITGGVTYPDLLHWTGESQHAPQKEPNDSPPASGSQCLVRAVV